MIESTKAERRWVLGFALFLIFLTSLPYLLAVANQGADWVFGGFLVGVEDGHSYIAKMLRGAQGEWLFRSPYSVLEQAGALVYAPYLLLGKLIGPDASHGQFVLAFHAFRALSIGLLCLAVDGFAAQFLEGRSHRRLALILVTLGGGLGWLLLAAGQLPLDFYSPEAFGFLAIFSLPHLVLARALLLWGLARYLRMDAASSGWGTALLWAALALAHLLSAAIGLLLVAAHLLITRALRLGDEPSQSRALRQAGWMLAGALPILIFNAYRYLGDTFLQGWAAQNQIPSPPLWHYALAYGLPLALGVWGLRQSFRWDARKASLLALWVVLLPILLYLPFGLQRRFAEGAWVALVVLALAAFESPDGRPRPGWRWSFLLLLPSTLLLLIGSLGVARAPRQPAYLPAGEVAAFQALGAMAEFDQMLLAGYASGNALPAWVPLRTVIGHGPETVGLAALAPQVGTFYQSPAEHWALLAAWEVDYVLVGPAERALAGGNFRAPDNLVPVYDQGGYQIYRLRVEPTN